MKRAIDAERWFNEGIQHYQAGNPQKALAAWGQAEALCRALIDAGQLQYLPGLAGTRANEGLALIALHRPEDALARYEEAAAIYQALIDAGQPQYRPNLADTRMNQGAALSALNRPEDALARYEEAAKIFQALIAAGQSQHRPNLARTRVNQGNALIALHRPGDALARHEEAAKIFQALIAAGQPQHRPNLAGTRMSQGIALCDLNRPEEALARHQEAAEIYRDLIADNQRQHRPDLARARMSEGVTLDDLNRPEEALARLKESAAIYRDLIAAGQPQHRPELARTRMNQGAALCDLNRPEDALARHEEAAAIYQDLIAEGQPQRRPDLAHTRVNQGNALFALNRPEEALARLEEAAAIYRDLIAAGQPQYRPYLARTRMNQGVALCDLNRPEDALARLEEAAAIYLNRPEDALARLEEAAAIYRDLIAASQPQYRPNLARTRMNEGNALSDLHRIEDALARYEEAAAIYQALIAAGQPQYRPNLAHTRMNAAIACVDRADGLETAIAYLDRALAVWESVDAIPAVALAIAPQLAALIARTRSAAGFAARVERLAQQVARALGGVAPKNLKQFYLVAEQAFARLFDAALDLEEWDLALTVIGTARAQRLAKLAQTDLLHRAAREDDPAELREYREAIRRFAELEILLNTGAGPSAGDGGAGGRGGGDADEQYRALYAEYTALRGELDALEQTLRQQELLPDLDMGLFDGAGLRQTLPPKAALLVLVERGESLAVVILTRDSGQAVPLAEWSDWTARLERITKTLKGRGRALRDKSGWDRRTASAEASASGMLPKPDTQAEALTEALAEQFWKPIQRAVGTAVNTVWLLPTGDLHGLPWQASAPPGWRCRLAPAPGFVRQALEAPPAALLHPTAAAPLGALAYAAPQSFQELFHMPLEQHGLLAAWGDAARPLAGLDPLSEPSPAHLVIAGHGDSDARIPGAARILVGRERYLGFGELWDTPCRPLSLYLSNCVVGRTHEVNGEPLGLISAGLLRGARYLVGWSVPVDDLGIALFSLLYHWLWRDCTDPEAALTRARTAFLTGDWPAAAVEWTQPLLAAHLRDLLAEWIQVPSRQPVRKERLREVLCGLHKDSGAPPTTLESWTAQLNAWRLQPDWVAAQTAAETLAARILDRRARFPFRYIGHFALGFGSTGHSPADV